MNEASVATPTDLQIILNAIPGNHLILLPDAPRFTIVGITDGLLHTTHTKREQVIGRPLFDVFPDNRADEHATGTINVQASLQDVLRHKTEQRLPQQRYDVANPHTGAFEYRVWAASNKPVLDAQGAVRYIIHTTEEITEQVRMQEAMVTKAAQLNESEGRFRRMVEQAPVPILLSRGEDVVIDSLNAPMLRAQNKTSFDEVLGKPILEVLPELKDQEVLQIVKNVQKTGVPFRGEEVPTDVLIDGNLKRFYFNYSYTPVTERGEVTGVLHVAVDVTPQVESRQKSEEIAEELKHFRFMANNAQDAFILIREDGSFAYLNKKALDAWGYTEEEAKQLRVPDIDPVYQEELFQQSFPQIFQQPVTRLESLHRRKDGTVYPIEASINGIMIDGNPHLFVVARDIAERKKAETAQLESEQQVRSIVESAPFPIGVFTGPEMRILLMNQAIIDLWGKEPHLAGTTVASVLPELGSQDMLAQLDQVFTTGVPFHASNQRVNLLVNGKPKAGYYNYSLTPLFDAEGNVYGVMNTGADVTEQAMAHKKLEEKEAALRNAVELAELGTWTMDLATGTVLFSERLAEMFGLDSVNTTMKEALSRVKMEDRDRVADALRRALEPGFDGRYEVSYEVANPKTGKNIIVRALGQTYYDKDGRPATIAGTTQDITVQQRAQAALEAEVQRRTKELGAAIEALNATNRELQRSNQQLEEFAHAASHDLKEPVRKIHFFTQQLKQQLSNHLGDAEMRSLGRIENATERMGNLIDDLLVYSHVSQRPHETDPVDLNVKLHRVLEDLELDIAEKGAVINVGPLPVVQGYRRQLQQLFQNLLSNALKYSKAGVPPRIHISATEVEEANQRYHMVSVKDNGIGFEQEYAEKIFQMFTRLHGKAEYSGTGVGLSIVKKVVEHHQGHIRVESVLGEGSTFSILLPVA